MRGFAKEVLRHAVLAVLVAVPLVASVGAALAQWDTDKLQPQIVPVAGQVKMLIGAGGNMGLAVGPDGLLVIDDQIEPFAPKVRAALDALGAGAPRFVINTHFHGDHVGGNVVVGKGATIMAQTNVRKRLEAGSAEDKPSPKAALPVVTYDDSVSVHWNGEEVKILHLPHGHTDGDSVVLFTGSKVAHLGDLFFNGAFPFIDLAGGGDVEQYTKNVAQLQTLVPAGYKIIPGHGPLAALADLAAFHKMLLTTTGIVKDGIAAHKSLAQLKAAGLPADWDSWGKGFVDTGFWIETIYTSLTRQR